MTFLPDEGKICPTKGNSAPEPLAATLKKDFPEVEQVARVNQPGNSLVSCGDKAIKLNTIAADPTILDLFRFDFLAGNPSAALAGQSGIVLTSAAAKTIFGPGENPIGKPEKRIGVSKPYTIVSISHQVEK